MFCAKCGSPINESRNFCNKCGARIYKGTVGNPAYQPANMAPKSAMGGVEKYGNSFVVYLSIGLSVAVIMMLAVLIIPQLFNEVFLSAQERAAKEFVESEFSTENGMSYIEGPVKIQSVNEGMIEGRNFTTFGTYYDTVIVRVIDTDGYAYDITIFFSQGTENIAGSEVESISQGF